jgi:hypothetical protein
MVLVSDCQVVRWYDQTNVRFGPGGKVVWMSECQGAIFVRWYDGTSVRSYERPVRAGQEGRLIVRTSPAGRSYIGTIVSSCPGNNRKYVLWFDGTFVRVSRAGRSYIGTLVRTSEWGRAGRSYECTIVRSSWADNRKYVPTYQCTNVPCRKVVHWYVGTMVRSNERPGREGRTLVPSSDCTCSIIVHRYYGTIVRTSPAGQSYIGTYVRLSVPDIRKYILWYIRTNVPGRKVVRPYHQANVRFGPGRKVVHRYPCQNVIPGQSLDSTIVLAYHRLTVATPDVRTIKRLSR